MANAPKDLLERVAFMGKVFKNTGVSAKEAASVFQNLSKSFQPLSPEIWHKKLNQKTTDDFIFEYMQQPVTSTVVEKTTSEEITIKDIKAAVRKLEEAQPKMATQTRDRTSFELADEIRTLMRHRDLTSTQMTRLNELIGIVQGSPAPSSLSPDDSYSISEQPYQRRTRRLEGQGISGDAVLTGNEERLDFYETEERIEVNIPSARERYFAKQKKPKSIESLKPIKRKLDI